MCVGLNVLVSVIFKILSSKLKVKLNYDLDIVNQREKNKLIQTCKVFISAELG